MDGIRSVYNGLDVIDLKTRWLHMLWTRKMVHTPGVQQ
jgi:hypothetical protein